MSGDSRLTIPKDALDLAVGVWYGVEPDEVDPEDTKAAEGDMLAVLEAVSPLILAAYLEAWAAEPNIDRVHFIDGVDLRARAAELRGGAK